MIQQTMILGGGLERLSADEPIVLTSHTTDRLDRFMKFWSQEPHALGQENSIVCSGGYALLAAGFEAPADGTREAYLMADKLMSWGIPSKAIGIEAESDSTLTNFTWSIAGGFIQPEGYSRDNPLGVVTHPRHMRRILDFSPRLGLPAENLYPILTTTDLNKSRELVLRAGYRAALFGATDAAGMVQRERSVLALLSIVRPPHQI